ncbi:DNA mismatch repair protein MSH3, partial [Tetrabaena socialis]
VGSYVPADSLELSVFDGVYTRMGASDNIMMGRSTFLEEMSDAAHLMRSATPASLVILDELGRGTATHDGVAVAAAVLHQLLVVTRCPALFVTHYPEVAAEAARWPGEAAACHMAYVREEEGEGAEGAGCAGAGVQAAEEGGAGGGAAGVGGARPRRPARITFLYKLRSGAADESFGLNVAQVRAGLGG